MDGSNTVASASYREPRPHARSAAARQEKTRGRRRISRKAPDLPHDAVRAGAESDGRLHTGTTTLRGQSAPQWVRGSFGLSLRAHHPEATGASGGTVEDLERVGIQLGTGRNWLGPRNRTSTGDNPSPLRSLTTSPDEPADHARAGSSCRPWPDQGEGCRMGCGRAWTAFGPGRETSLSFRPHSQPGSLQAGVKSEISSFVVGLTENPSAPATLVTLLDTPAVPSRPVCGLSRRLSYSTPSLPSRAFPLHPGIVGHPPSALTACGLPCSVL